jgi:hypothetical protein
MVCISHKTYAVHVLYRAHRHMYPEFVKPSSLATVKKAIDEGGKAQWAIGGGHPCRLGVIGKLLFVDVR